MPIQCVWFCRLFGGEVAKHYQKPTETQSLEGNISYIERHFTQDLYIVHPQIQPNLHRVLKNL